MPAEPIPAEPPAAERNGAPPATITGQYASGGSAEIDFYGGYKGTVGAIGYDVGLLQYYYPGSYPSPYNSPNTLEGYLGLLGLVAQPSRMNRGRA